MSSPELIDRSVELAALEGAWRDVAAGRPRVVLVRAHPGLGKTRLLSAFEAEHPEDAVVLRGSCVHANGVASPLLPFVTALFSRTLLISRVAEELVATLGMQVYT